MVLLLLHLVKKLDGVIQIGNVTASNQADGLLDDSSRAKKSKTKNRRQVVDRSLGVDQQMLYERDSIMCGNELG